MSLIYLGGGQGCGGGGGGVVVDTSATIGCETETRKCDTPSTSAIPDVSSIPDYSSVQDEHEMAGKESEVEDSSQGDRYSINVLN